DIEATDHVRAATERDHRVAVASCEFQETRDRVLVFGVDDEIGDVVEARGPEANEILVPSSGGVRHARDVIAREIPLAHDALDVCEVLARQSRRRNLELVERRDGTPNGEIDVQAMSEIRRQGRTALEVCDGAVEEGFSTLVICEKGRSTPYARFFRTTRDKEGRAVRGMVDEAIILSKFQEVLDEKMQDRLRKANAVFIPNRSFTSY